MKNRRVWRRALIGAVVTLSVYASRSFAFLETTETQGELPSNISGVWLVVNQLEFTQPEPSPSPGAPTPAPHKEAASSVRFFSVPYLLRIVHYPKAEADKMREADRKMEEA